MSKLDDEKKKKKDIAELEEVVEETGQESEKKGAKATMEVMKDLDEKKKGQRNFLLNKLESLIKNKLKYREYLVQICDWNLRSRIDWPLGYFYRVEVSPKGIEFTLVDRYFKSYKKGMTPRYDPEWDLYGIDTIMTQMENTVDKLEYRGVYGESAEKIIPGTNIIVPERKS